MALTNNYTTNERGAVVITGNTLGLSRKYGTQDPGDDNAINQFITTDISLPTPAAWKSITNSSKKENITFDWANNSSSAYLNMLTGYTVLRAYLIWGGMSVSQGTSGKPTVDVSTKITEGITFITPGGNSTVLPDGTPNQISTGGDTFYNCVANVTDKVTAGGTGLYTVKGVPSAVNINEDYTLDHAGWTLIVAYKNPSLPPRNLSIFTGATLINPNSTEDISVEGFKTPSTGDINARICVSAQEGDAVRGGDQMLFGPSTSSLTPLYGINNPVDNFFCSQINIGDPISDDVGKIDQTGTFGERNAKASAGINTTAVRQGWDITNVNGSSSLTKNQTAAVVRLRTSDDIYMLNAVGVQIDTIKIEGTKSVSKATADLGDTLTYTVTLKNSGGTSQKVNFNDSTPSGTTFNGVINTASAYTGTVTPNLINVNFDIDAGKFVTLSWNVVIGDTLPASNQIVNKGVITVPDSGLIPENVTATTKINTADVSIAKVLDPLTPEAVPGSQLIYDITVTNAGPDNAQNVNINDTVPAAFNSLEVSTDKTNWSPWTGSYSVGTLNKGTSSTIYLRGTVKDNTTADIVNTAKVTSKTFDPNTGNNSATLTTPVQPKANLSITKSVVGSVVAGSQVIYSITVANAGPSNAQTVVVADPIPAVISSPYYSVDGIAWSPWLGSYTITTLTVGVPVTIEIRGILDSAATGNLVNTATATSTRPSASVSSTDTTPITVSSDVGISKSQNPSPAEVGQQLTYTIVVKNYGPSTATGVVMTDNVSSILNGAQYSYNNLPPWTQWTGNYTIGTMAPNESKTIYIQGTVVDDPPADAANIASVTSTSPDNNQLNNQVDIPLTLDNTSIVVTKTASAATVNGGEEIIYDITVENTGAFVAKNVIITDFVPTEVLDPMWKLSTEPDTAYKHWNDSVNIGSVDIGKANEVTINIKGTVKTSPQVSSITNNVSVTLTNDSGTGTNEASVTTQISTSADISVIKTPLTGTPTAGNKVEYELVISNAGPSDSKQISLTETIPSGLTDVEISSDGGKTWTPLTTGESYPVGDLAVGKSITLELRATVDSSTLDGQLNNSVTVNGVTYDPILTNNISNAAVTVSTSADLEIQKTESPEPIVAGNTVTYTLVVTNNGPSDAQQVVVEDNIPSTILNPVYSTSSSSNFVTWTGTYTVASLAANDSFTLTIKGTASSSALQSISNTATVSSSTTDPNTANNTSNTVTAVTTSADVSVTKLTIVNSVIAGREIIYSITVANAGPSDALQVSLADVVPTNITSPSFSIDGGKSWSAWSTPYSIGTLAAGSSKNILLSGTVSPLTTGNLVNTATVSSTTTDPVPSNNQYTNTTAVNALADMSIIKTANPNPANVGKTLIYDLVLANSGPSNAADVVVTDNVLSTILDSPQYSLDGGITWKTWTGTYSYGLAAAGLLQSIKIRGTLLKTAGSSFSNTATVSTTTPESNTDNNTSTVAVTVNPAADLSIVKTGSPSNVIVGNLLTYTILVSNAGPNAASNVVVTDNIPASLSQVEFSIDGGSTWAGWSGSYTIASIAANDSFSILIRGKVNALATGNIVNVATISSSSTDINTANNTAIAVTTVDALAQLSVISTVCPNYAVVGKKLTYTIRVSNVGPSDAQNVVVVDCLCDSIMGAEFSIDGGITWNQWRGSYSLGTLVNGCSITIIICGVVSPTFEKCIVNTVQINSTTTNPNALNAISTTSIKVGSVRGSSGKKR